MRDHVQLHDDGECVSKNENIFSVRLRNLLCEYGDYMSSWLKMEILLFRS